MAKSENVQHLDLGQVLNLTGLTRTELQALVTNESFPAPLPLGPWHTAWVRDDVQQWINENRDPQ